MKIYSFRSLADAEFKKEAQNAQQLEEFQKKQPKKGYFSGWWGSSSSTNENTTVMKFP